MKNRLFQKWLYALVCCIASSFVAHAQKPQASFTSDITSGCSPLIVHFQSTSSGQPTSWEWNLGNGAVSYDENPAGVYVNPGTYTVKLIVKNAFGSDSVIQTNYITVYAQPEVNFTSNISEGCPALKVQFTDNSKPGSGSLSGWIWDFGDGQIMQQAQQPTHVYQQSGIYTVSLTVTNSKGCRQTLKKNQYIIVHDTVKANFEYDYTNVCKPPAEVKFINQSVSKSALSYQWIFNDGGISTEPSPSHTFTTAGNYNVQLIAVTEFGCSDTVSKPIAIGKSIPNFEFSSNTCSNNSIHFTNTSSPLPTSAVWDFGDGTTATTLHANHTYTAAGTYEVKMSGDFGSCKNSVTKTIVITDKPATGFTVVGSNVCALPATIQFNNQTIGATSFIWNFGDGTTSTDSLPTHIYTKGGFYNVSLIAFNGKGCSDTLMKNDIVKVGPPEILGFSNLPVNGCAPKTIYPKANIHSAEPIVKYEWNFGDSSTSTLPNPSHTYEKGGTYNVTLTIYTSSGCTQTYTMNKAVALGQAPEADFSADPLNTCAQTEIQFHDETKGEVTDWWWDFGDGESTEQNPGHFFLDTGYHTVMLVASNNGCSDTIIKKRYIYIKPPIALIHTNFSCNEPYSREFVDSSVGATSWQWDFGDGTSSTQKNPPLHTFPHTGIFYVRLLVSNGTCTDIRWDTVEVVDEKPLFSFTPLEPAFCKFDTVSFSAYNYNAANISALNWLFGDGTSTGFKANNANVKHLYNKNGSFTPQLIAKDKLGCKDTITNAAVSFNVYGPTANFSNTAGTCVHGNITFTDASVSDGTHTIQQWQWSFGDGSTQTYTALPFEHTYDSVGTFNVKLVVEDNYGCKDSIIKTKAVQITQPVAAFRTSDSMYCSNNKVSFINSSKGETLKYEWTFGDGTTSTAANPQHTYTAEGNYSVKLKTTDKFGCVDEEEHINAITITNPIASFSLAQTTNDCPPFLVEPKNTSLNTTSISWNFGDGSTAEKIDTPSHLYTEAGTFTLKLIAKGHGECYDSSETKIIIKGPSGSFTYEPITGCNPVTVNFSAQSKNAQTFTWDFNDGTVLTGNANQTYTYTHAGRFLPKLVLTDTAGCKVGIENRDTIVIADVQAKIANTVQVGCDSSKVLFTDSSLVINDNIVAYKWNFGDGDSSSLRNPTHNYTQTKIYQSSLQVTTSLGCSSTINMPVNVLVHVSPAISISMPDSICQSSNVNFQGNTISAETPLSWQWNFGNGDSSNVPNPSYVYSIPSVYSVQAKAIDNNGCYQLQTHPLVVVALPAVDAGLNTYVCLGNEISLQATGASKYIWENNGFLSCFNCANPTIHPDTSAFYYVTGQNSFGCIAKDSVFVEVKQPVHITVSNPDTLCLGETTTLKATGAQLYQWTPSLYLSDATSATPILQPAKDTTLIYNVVGSDDKQCFSDTASVAIKVYPVPQMQVEEETISLNVGNSVQLKATYSSDVTSWRWTPPKYLDNPTSPTPVATPNESITYTVVAANGGSCIARSQIAITVLCNGSNIFIPNTFSPNNDGMNDVFYPRGKGLFGIRNMKIFNRWGQVVYERSGFVPNDATAAWDGNFKGKPASSDVYVYILEIVCNNSVVIPVKGNVTLLR